MEGRNCKEKKLLSEKIHTKRRRIISRQLELSDFKPPQHQLGTSTQRPQKIHSSEIVEGIISDFVISLIIPLQFLTPTDPITPQIDIMDQAKLAKMQASVRIGRLFHVFVFCFVLFCFVLCGYSWMV